MQVAVENLHFAYETESVLKGVDFWAKSGQFIGIVGPNGCGKSSFLKCVYHVLKPKQGVIRLGEEDTKHMSHRACAQKLAVVSQHHVHDFDFTVEELVIMGRSPHKSMMASNNQRDLEVVQQALCQVGMTKFKERRFSSLSGGEQQRVILARALAQEPKILILDEPTNHMDIKYQLQLLDLVKHMPITVIAALHDLNLATSYCDYLYVMKNGRVHAFGKPEMILTEELIAEVYEVKAKIIQDADSKRRFIHFCSLKD